MKKLLTILVLFFALTAFAWSGHDALTYYIVSSMPDIADIRVPITPYTYENIDNRIYNMEKANFSDYLGQRYNPWEDDDVFISVFPNPLPVDNIAPLWQIFSVYSYEPDLGMDQDLELNSSQKLTGGSQGWRHMEYRLLFMRFGEVSKSVEYFSDLSTEVWDMNDPYWAYRFMARAIHYLEDIGMPYHTFPAPTCELFKLIFNFDKWYVVFANYHYAYDFYGGYRLWTGYEPLVKAIKEAEPVKIKNPRKDALKLRRYARGKLSRVYYEMKELMGDDLESGNTDLATKEYFDELVATKDTSKLDELTIELLSKVASYVKGYILYMREIQGW
ncbi:phospholipase [Kosmotoga arenicorallina S304]|uniref:Phospholipase n=1 Tax=Kosmotoga arenicorallina S304 TaxID=1453497 RepID=A0A176K0S8_9BACT|nr:phospholipase [Kosmotoga arenicorallina]OAA29925.1 phospholipase [Kosmotoga arenicorallina S304]